MKLVAPLWAAVSVALFTTQVLGFDFFRRRIVNEGRPVTPAIHDFPDNHLAARWDNPKPVEFNVWCEHVQKGKLLLDAIQADDKKAAKLLGIQGDSAESEFKDFPSDFSRWYYFVRDANEFGRGNYCKFDGTWGVSAALRGIQVSDKSVSDGGKNRCYYVSHGWPFDEKYPLEMNRVDAKGQPYRNGGKAYKTTNANFVYSVNHDEGVLVAMDRFGPKWMAPDFAADALPGLQRASDVMYGVWKFDYHSKEEYKRLRYYVVVAISNPLARGIIAYAAKGHGGLYPWPGKEIYMNTDRGKALLATPNGFALAYFLIQHKDQFDGLKIVKVNLFSCKDLKGHACMVFTLKERVDNPNEDPNKPQKDDPPLEGP